MSDLVASPSARVFAIACAILCLELVFIALATALVRQRRNVWLNEEDARRFSGTVTELEHPDVARIRRVHANLLENLVPFVVVGMLWLVSGPSSPVGSALFVLFVVARILHPVAYLSRRGRARTACFTLGFAVIVSLSLWVAFRALPHVT